MGQLFYNADISNTEQPRRVTFGSFDPAAEVEITQRNLPHWFQPGAAMFITFRTADSLPKEVVLRWQHELEEWLADRDLPKSLARSTVQQALPNHGEMPNHMHAILQFRAGAALMTVSQSWMRYTARQIHAATGGAGAFWQPEPFDHVIRSPEQFEYLQGYVAENPRKAGLRNGEFLYWERM